MGQRSWLFSGPFSLRSLPGICLVRPHGVATTNQPAPRGALWRLLPRGRAGGLRFFREGRRTEDAQQSSKKKTMKTKTQIKSGLGSRSAQLNTDKPRLARIDFARRRVNRTLDTETLLGLMRGTSPRFFELAEVVGRWVWIQFTEQPAVEVRQKLAQLGFHWNNTRQAWQHPCGLPRSERATFDPRKVYGSSFAADHMSV